MTTTICLDGELTIHAAAAACETLRAAVAAAPGPVVLDLAQVQACDSAGAQLLLATQHTVAARGHTVRLINLAAPVQDALSTLGLHGLHTSKA
jgi:anti-anti-sigma factor